MRTPQSSLPWSGSENLKSAAENTCAMFFAVVTVASAALGAVFSPVRGSTVYSWRMGGSTLTSSQ